MNNSFRSTLAKTCAAAVMAAASLFPFQAHAGLFDDDEARRAILDIRAKIDALRADLDKQNGLKADKTSTLDLLAQNESLLQDIAKLRGQVEVLTNELSNAQQRQKDFYNDLDTRLRKIEPQKITVDGKEASVEPGEQKFYDAALTQFKAGDYKAASIAFDDFQRRFPDSPFGAAAQYWLGNAYYAQRDYRSAIDAQREVVRKYPDSAKAGDALLNIASCYVELKDKAGAKKTLESVRTLYPGSPAAQTAKERLAALK